MRYYIGIDLGTSSCKGILTDREGNIIREHSVSYEVIYPREGWTEQNPIDWLGAMHEILDTLKSGVEKYIYGISFGGQMHGLVVLDEKDDVIRPCILWNDGRTEKETAYLNEVIGKEKLSAYTGNIAFAGFTAPKILWLRENEPENFAKISKIMLPKDYLAYKLTGVFSTDYSDASGTLLLDVENKRWSDEMCEICGVKEEWLPTLYESYEVTGNVLSKYSLPNAIVTAGAGDNAAAAIGTGCIADGDCNISLGTSGTLFICQDKFTKDDKNSLHYFAHANGKWHSMGCILSAASCRKWWLETILDTKDYEADEALIASAEDNDLIFLPYLSGERSPYNDVNLRGAFIGLSHSTTRAQMSRTIMEGVAFAIKDCLEIAKSCGADVKSATVCGGGAKSEVWLRIMANALNIPLSTVKTEQGPAYGAAILAMVGAGEYKNADEAAKKIVSVNQTIYPVSKSADHLAKKYTNFKKLYPLLKK